jgi:hypothetical protein
MDWLFRIFDWLSDHEAGISAVAAIIVISGVVLAGLRLLVRRRGGTIEQQPSSAVAEPAPGEEASAPDLDPLTVPGFEGRPAIVVLPFDNLGGDSDQEYFADCLALAGAEGAVAELVQAALQAKTLLPSGTAFTSPSAE